MTFTRDSEMSGTITDEGIARYRARIGILIPQPPPFNTVAHEDTIRHYAWGYGDDNSLYNDPEYGARTRWGSIIGAPGFVQTMGITTAGKIPKEVREKGAGALSGVPNYLSGSTWENYLPIKPGDKIFRRYFVSKVEEKRSEFGGGEAVVVHFRDEYINQDDRLAAVHMTYFFHVEREASEKSGKYMAIEDPRYDDDYLRKIDEAYENEYIRGADTLYWEDANVGDELPGIVKGPLCTTDIISWHVGQGMGQFRIAPNKLGYYNRKRVPNFYTKNEYGHWDCAQRVHWDNARARRVGNPRAYDYGRMRTQYLNHIVTNWMGDDAWLFRSSDQIRKFNYHGDVSWVKGKIVRKYAEGKAHYVDLDLWIENQRGEITAPGQATVILPSRVDGPVVLPGDTGRYNPYPQETPYSVRVPGS